MQTSGESGESKRGGEGTGRIRHITSEADSGSNSSKNEWKMRAIFQFLLEPVLSVMINVS